MICTAQAKGKTHDVCLLKASRTHIHPAVEILADTGYQGLQKLPPNTTLPTKRKKKQPRSSADKRRNKALASRRVVVENVLAALKRFKIISDTYRNRRKRFNLRFNLIAGIYNFQLQN